ncbi:hypothetical protein ACFQZ4_38570 [Catellatospora coxensis]
MTAPVTASRGRVPASATAGRGPLGGASLPTWLAAAAAGMCAAAGWLRVLPGTRMALLLALAATAPLLLAAASRLLRRTASTRDTRPDGGPRPPTAPRRRLRPCPGPCPRPRPCSCRCR